MLESNKKSKLSNNFIEDKTVVFTFSKKKENEILSNLSYIYEALREKGYDPLSQIAGYLLSGDPAYITASRGARKLISSFNREEILKIIVKRCLADFFRN
ncbi:MAG: IreB family regulatory phosphoprotein [Clostridia bacterium]|nr:IreB family regulatory phosphoprotein [Clostridia bacterium]